jgi:hypothetical protein
MSGAGETAGGPGFRVDAAVPILATTDLDRAVEHYRRMGFAVRPDESGAYAFAHRDRSWLHLALVGDVDHDKPRAAYLYVDDADATFAAWRAAGVAGLFDDPSDRPWGLREGTYLDPDGNRLRVGSWLPGHGPPAP